MAIFEQLIIVGGVTFVQSIMQVCNLETFDSGVYSCIASNSLGNDTASFTLDVETEGRIVKRQDLEQSCFMFLFYFAVTIVVIPEDSEVIVGDTILMTCVASGTFTPNISWSNGELVLSNDSARINIYTVELEKGGITFVRSILEICSLETSDSGTYSCIATLPDNSDSGDFTISVIGQPPELVIVPNDVSVTAGSSIFLTCVASGFPLPVFTWQKSNLSEPQITNSSRVAIYEELVSEGGVTFVQSVLEICSVQEADALNYTCSATNKLGTDNATFELAVNPEGK